MKVLTTFMLLMRLTFLILMATESFVPVLHVMCCTINYLRRNDCQNDDGEFSEMTA